MPTLSLVKFLKFEPVLLTVPYLSINYSHIVPFFADPITYRKHGHLLPNHPFFLPYILSYFI